VGRKSHQAGRNPELPASGQQSFQNFLVAQVAAVKNAYGQDGIQADFLEPG